MRKGEELKVFRYASAAATCDYITACDIIPNRYPILLIYKTFKQLNQAKIYIKFNYITQLPLIL